ncbi:hypothetical protein A5647_15755 [Mycobacterium sp. 1100029.7]|nr:hypothetical protein A5647_15755 [Mycobacterium sp. 1100029.7]
MRIVRLVAAVLAILTAGLLLATPALAQPPFKLTDHITDNSNALSDSDRAAIGSAIDGLYQDQHVQLWVVYVDNFSRFKPDNWADKTRSASGMGDRDVLLAVATNTKAYSFTVPPKVHNLTATELSALRTNKIEPAVGAKDWAGAAVAAADGLDITPGLTDSPHSATRIWLIVAIGVIVVAGIIVAIFVLYRARRRRRAVAHGGHNDGQRVESLGQALAIADARLRQLSDYLGKHRDSVGAPARTQYDEAQRHLAAAHDKQASDESGAIAHANSASTLAAQAQTSANADVLAAHRAPRRRGTAST